MEGKAGYEAPVIRGNGRAIVKVLYDGGSEDREVDDNAALIAAAPELLEACKAMLLYVGAIQDRAAAWIGNEYDKLPDDKKFSLSEAGFFDLIDQANELRKMVKAAIAQAEGGAQ